MSKKLIAGAGVVASLAVALAPLATYADITSSDIHDDELVITVSSSCTFGFAGDGNTAVTHTGTWNTSSTGESSSYTYDDVSNVTGDRSEHSFTTTLAAGTVNDELTTTTLKVFCNNAGGYTVKADLGNLAAATNGNPAIAPAQTYSATSTGYHISVGETPTVYYATTGNKIAEKATVSAATGDAITVTYGIGIASSQAADTYQGDVVYTLYKGVEQ